MERLLTYKKYIFIGLGAVIALFFYFSFGTSPIEEEMIPIVFEELDSKEEVVKSSIYIDVKGAVVREGVYTLEDGARVKDVIQLAGGFLNDANKNVINLAQLLTDEMLLYVPFINESEALITNYSVDDGKVNVNIATSSELETLPGIGPSKALAIVEYRETNGLFKTIDDLKNVAGIGETTYEKLKENIKIK